MNQGGLACIMYNVGVQSMYKGIDLDAGARGGWGREGGAGESSLRT